MAAPPLDCAGAQGWAIDASVTVAWSIAEEEAPFAERLLDPIGAQPIRAPLPWVQECVNVLQGARRRRRVDARRGGSRARGPTRWSRRLPVGARTGAAA